MFRKRCAWCQEIKTMNRQKQRYCDQTCAAYGRQFQRTDKRRKEIGRKAGAASAKVRRAQADARLAQMTVAEAERQGYWRGFYAGKLNERRKWLTKFPPSQAPSAPTLPGAAPGKGPGPSGSSSAPLLRTGSALSVPRAEDPCPAYPIAQRPGG